MKRRVCRLECSYAAEPRPTHSCGVLGPSVPQRRHAGSGRARPHRSCRPGRRKRRCSDSSSPAVPTHTACAMGMESVACVCWRTAHDVHAGKCAPGIGSRYLHARHWHCDLAKVSALGHYIGIKAAAGNCIDIHAAGSAKWALTHARRMPDTATARVCQGRRSCTAARPAPDASHAPMPSA